ncbi:MAG: hypothetical protein ABI356_15100 [Steroidobacteraceae bacterium]
MKALRSRLMGSALVAMTAMILFGCAVTGVDPEHTDTRRECWCSIGKIS